MEPPPRARPCGGANHADAGALLARALIADAARAGLTAVVRDWRTHPWASATFTGTRHRATLALAGKGGAGEGGAWLAGLAETELALRGHLVADLAATRAADGLVELEALTIDAA